MMKVLCLAVVLSGLFYTVDKTVTFHAEIESRNHTRVFEYLSTVDKFQDLNPTIVNISRWTRVNETSFYVECTERLSQVPFVTNHGKSHYHVRRDGDSLSLTSDHLTCFTGDLFCLPTKAVLTIWQVSKEEVGYREEITYACPWILSPFCFEEVARQRSLIVTNLRKALTTS